MWNVCRKQTSAQQILFLARYTKKCRRTSVFKQKKSDYIKYYYMAMIQLLFRIFIKMQHLTDDLADATKLFVYIHFCLGKKAYYITY